MTDLRRCVTPCGRIGRVPVSRVVTQERPMMWGQTLDGSETPAEASDLESIRGCCQCPLQVFERAAPSCHDLEAGMAQEIPSSEPHVRAFHCLTSLKRGSVGMTEVYRACLWTMSVSVRRYRPPKAP